VEKEWNLYWKNCWDHCLLTPWILFLWPRNLFTIYAICCNDSTHQN